MSADVFHELYETASRYVADHEDLRNFGEWPERPQYHEKSTAYVPAARTLSQWNLVDESSEADFHRVIQKVLDVAHWKQTYTETEVGSEFLARYGYFELLGPDGHFFSDVLRAYVGYWGPGLRYDWHHHEAEEIYCVLSGAAEFHLDGGRSQWLRRGDTRFHYSNQPHAMTTTVEPVLTFVLWRGRGMTGLPMMGVNEHVVR